MKKLIAMLLCLMMVLPTLALAEGTTDITLWTYPIGGWSDEAKVNEIVAAFTAKNPGITVTVQYLDYTSGDDQVTTAIAAGTTPDLILEGPDRLVANWGAAGKMLDLADLFTDEVVADIEANNPIVLTAVKGADGAYYEYPLCMTAHCMVINKTAFEQADALQYVDLETRTWTTENFEKALRALTEAGLPTGVVFCGGQGGDQGTRALVKNLYGAAFTNPEHTLYTIDSEAGIKGLETLQGWVAEGILNADPAIVGGDEIALFCNGTMNMAFCWNAASAEANKTTLADGIEMLPMAFPSDDGVPEMDGGVWGFGIFNNGDEAKIEAAKKFIQFVCDDPDQVADSVFTTGYFPVKASVGDIYSGTDKADKVEYGTFVPFLGDIYQVTTNWAVQRTEWWNLLQRVFNGGNVADEVAVYIANANAQ